MKLRDNQNTVAMTPKLKKKSHTLSVNTKVKGSPLRKMISSNNLSSELTPGFRKPIEKPTMSASRLNEQSMQQYINYN